ncbi:DUF4236 domain-containing protein [Thauera aromatica]|nr:DUF4236 domain-containing protein [Thauera aromatica]MCK2126744.1 DUF4236 domain-containing protein [Thauera aromatica]
MDEKLVSAAKKQQGDRIRDLIQGKCDEINAQTEDLGRIHVFAPSCHEPLVYEVLPFEVVAPVCPVMAKPGFFARLFKSLRAPIDAKNCEAMAAYESARADWEAQKRTHEAEQARQCLLIEKARSGAVTAMEIFLEQRLQQIAWPQETNVSFEFLGEGLGIVLDVDLPEIEDIPRRVATVPQRGCRLNVKDMSALQVQKLYMQHVHGVGFRLIGEVFAALPTVNEVVASGYSQRPDKATGQIGDEYLYSVRVIRSEWEKIDFGNLESIDVIEALSRFDLRRQMSKSGVFAPIEPFPVSICHVGI